VAANVANKVWKTETGQKPDASEFQEIIKSTGQDGQISFRRVIQALTVG